MKDLSPKCKNLFFLDSSDALRQIRLALDCLWNDKMHTIHDRVADDYCYEELIGTLLSADAAIVELKQEIANLEKKLGHKQ